MKVQKSVFVPTLVGGAARREELAVAISVI
jgi:hypothetical protein